MENVSNLSFPQKLFYLLENDYYHSSILKWSSNGLCFRIIDLKKFVKVIIPQYFKRK
jgi:hypothetical protein